MNLLNPAISAARSAYYWITEPLKLRWLRFLHDDDYDPDQLIYNGPCPLISVYIPTHNRSDLLIGRALYSVSRQSYPRLDVVVAAHGCTDDTVELVTKLATGGGIPLGRNGKGDVISACFTGQHRIRVIEVPRTQTYPPTPENHWFCGPVVPANAALSECRGEWIARIDDDDEWTRDHLESLLRFAQEGNYEFVSSAYETHEKTVAHDGHRIPIGGTQTWLYRSYLAAFRYNPECWRKRYDRVNDTDLAQRFRNMGVRIGHLNQVTAKVLPRPGTNAVGLKAYQSDERATLANLAF